MQSPSGGRPAGEAAQTLVIGYGNALRGDDAAGRWVAEAVASLGLARVVALSLTELTPELAPELARAEAAVFIDASLEAAGAVSVRPLRPGAAVGLSHSGAPEWLLALAGHLYGRIPPAWVVSVPGQRFALGEPLSPETQRHCYAALLEVQRLIARAGT